MESACQLVDWLIGQCGRPKTAFRRVNSYLWGRCRFLAKSRDYLRHLTRSRYNTWRSKNRHVDALCDGRKHNTGNHDDYDPPQEDLDVVASRAAFKFEKRIQPAWDEALTKGEISQATMDHYHLKPGDWCEAPRKFADAIRAEVDIFYTWSLGRRARDNASGSLIGSYDGIASLDCIMADDFTWPIYFHVIEDGQLLYFGRGQCLLFMDFRSLKILGWAFIPAPQYNALAIYRQCIRTFEAYGVPDILYFERNIWERSKLLKGQGQTDAALSYPELSTGLGRLGLSFLHAHRARSKTIERVGGLLQDHMGGERGWCGRDMRNDCPEDTKRLIVQIERMKDPRAAADLAARHFMSFEQWQERFAQIVAAYNARPQRYGRILQGVSPNEGFEKFLDHTNPHHQLDARICCLFAPSPRTVCVTENGIKFKIGFETYKYSGRELQPFLAAGSALAHFDPEEPEIIIVTDLNRSVDSAVCVRREPSVNRLECLFDSDSRQLAQASRQNAATTAALRERFKSLKTRFKIIEPPCPLPKRETVLSDETLELAKTFDRKKAEKRGGRNTDGSSDVAELNKFLGPTEPTPEQMAALEAFEREAARW